MKDDAYRRLLQLERRYQDLAEKYEALLTKRRTMPMVGARTAILQPVSTIAGRTESSGVFSITHGTAKIFDLIVRDTSDPWEMKKITGNSVDRVVPLGNISTEALPANEFVFALSYNGIYINAFSGVSGIVHAYTPSGGIAARSTLTMGSATCTLYDCNASGVLSSTANTETIYNMTAGAIAGSTHIVAARNTAGLLVAIVEDCGGA